ncbi:glycosyltransferase [Lachnoclostridium sp. Marseille-P6806]|uniref:glycosyltransferase n=1 Tax=Lachnoclostridium sp. Marseille-P6806 TaxID=2364793 RepID=UPI00102F9753|nr:glycosyltransferase [Lachnoclostridium sp. Marseille-P6806]
MVSVAEIKNNSSRPRLLLVVPALHQGGFERVCVLTARLLAPFYEITIAAFTTEHTDYDVTGLTVVDLGLPSRAGRLGKLVTWQARVRALKRLKKKLGIRISYSLGQTANLANVFARAGDRCIGSIRSYQDMQNPWKIRLFCRRFDQVICCSAAIEEELRRDYGCGSAVTLYNPVSVPERAALAEGRAALFNEREDIRRFTERHAVLFMSMGREDDVKGFWHLIKAFAVLRREAGDVARAGLVIIGLGDFAEYKALASELGIAEHVLFTGVLHEPHPLLQMADGYILTSINEGFPNALVEAMALGVPVIAADCPTGPREILISGAGAPCGVLLPPLSGEKDLSAEHIPEEDIHLAQSMRALLESPREEAGRAGKVRAADFSMERYRERCREFLGI